MLITAKIRTLIADDQSTQYFALLVHACFQAFSTSVEHIYRHTRQNGGVHKVVVTRKRRLARQKEHISRARVASRFLLTTTCLRVPKAHMGQTHRVAPDLEINAFVTTPDDFATDTLLPIAVVGIMSP